MGPGLRVGASETLGLNKLMVVGALRCKPCHSKKWSSSVHVLEDFGAPLRDLEPWL